ncbi:Serine/Threonine kinase domain protein (macronuclear) [Tetrahymena thermophila SB210]|uniref:Serine/Threonine kinase domain protein n=1 Tax=Tetrahymena thermophila (strain SB210) TaxID=312017 RepID=Q240P0_TETTS|nr:Serine/Threonine kinase domain protein [Tetrahymena thermophila SB210]EAS02374.2 Serine/Threonine kinase domain protein [Tetrahymena thermophila SB210]|eukprot:XP_001022619.2 Serine/Threonine kinase domain protein [Tetrahymena thermophila SB210]
MGNVCQNQREQTVYENRDKSPKKLQARMPNNQIYNQQDPTQSEIREFMTDLNGEIQNQQQDIYMSSEFQRASQKISISDFRLEKVLGKGSFGKVMLVTHLVEQKQYAMKVLLKKSIKNERQKRHTLTERQILEKIDHPFIVKLHYAFQTNEKLYLVLDFMVGGELFHHLKKSGKFSEEVTRFYASQIVIGLEHLHQHKIIYRDLKPENILLDSEGNLKLADFGLSKIGVDQNAPAHSLCGTPEYLAPEIITSKVGHDKTVDWWSFGALVYEMLTGSPPFYSNNKKQMLHNIIYKPIPIPKNLSDTAKSLLQQLLVVNPKNRLGYGDNGTSDVKNHPFFATINWEAMKERKIKTPLNINVTDERDTKYFDPYILKQQAVDTPVSYNQDLFKFSQFTYNKKIEEVQMGEIQRNDSSEYFDLNGMCQHKKDKVENGEDEDNSEIQREKIQEVQKALQDQTISSDGKTIDQDLSENISFQDQNQQGDQSNNYKQEKNDTQKSDLNNLPVQGQSILESSDLNQNPTIQNKKYLQIQKNNTFNQVQDTNQQIQQENIFTKDIDITKQSTSQDNNQQKGYSNINETDDQFVQKEGENLTISIDNKDQNRLFQSESIQTKSQVDKDIEQTQQIQQNIQQRESINSQISQGDNLQEDIALITKEDKVQSEQQMNDSKDQKETEEKNDISIKQLQNKEGELENEQIIDQANEKQNTHTQSTDLLNDEIQSQDKQQLNEVEINKNQQKSEENDEVSDQVKENENQVIDTVQPDTILTNSEIKTHELNVNKQSDSSLSQTDKATSQNPEEIAQNIN